MRMIWRSLGVQARFMLFAALGAVALVIAVVATVSYQEYRALDARLHDLSANELQSLNALVETAIRQRLNDKEDIAIKVFNAWFDSRNASYPGKLWSVWSPKVAAFVKELTPERAPKIARDAIDEEVLRTGRIVARFDGDDYRYSLPIVMGRPLSAPKETCQLCHGELMGLKEGETIAVFSSRIAAGDEIAARNGLLMKIAGVGLIAAVGMIAASWLILALIVVSPIKGVVGAMRRLAGGDLGIDFSRERRGDEIGEMQAAVTVFRDAAREKARLEQEAQQHRAQSERDRAAAEGAQREAIAQERALVNGSIGAALERLAGKELSYRMMDQIPEAYRALKDNFNRAIGELECALDGVAESTTGIDEEARQIAAATENLSHRTEQQAATLEQTTAALNGISDTVKRAAEGAAHARTVVESTAAESQQSQHLVGEAIGAIDSIAATSAKIGGIIHVIDEIAFQTNLLALNAGVEAARAGEQGKGFAVVASEVRGLAQRSAAAAKEIKDLISAATQEVGHGVRLVRETGAALERTISRVGDISRIVAEIADGANQQAGSLTEINTAIGELDRATQTNAGAASETSASTRTLAAESERQARLVGEFRLSRTSHAAAA